MPFEMAKINVSTFQSFLSDRYGFHKVKVEEIATGTGGCYHIYNRRADGVKEEFMCKVTTCFNPVDPPYIGVFKVCHPTKQALVMRHLIKSGFKCSQPKPSIFGKDAEKYANPYTVASVFTYLPGTALYREKIDSQTKYDIGVLTGHYRLTMDDFVHEAFPKLTPDEILIREDLPHLLRMCEPMVGEANRQKLRSIVSGCHDIIKTLMEKLPIAVIHGDLWPGNVIRLDGSPNDESPLKKFGLIDFELCKTSFPVHDFANILVYDAFYSDIEHIPHLTRPLVDGYCSVCTVTEDEKRVLQFALCYKIAKLLIFALSIPADYPYQGWQELHNARNPLFVRLVKLWEIDRDELYSAWFGKQ